MIPPDSPTRFEIHDCDGDALLAYEALPACQPAYRNTVVIALAMAEGDATALVHDAAVALTPTDASRLADYLLDFARKHGVTP